MNTKLYKYCPRCNKRAPKNQPVCERCGLIFLRMEKVSNRAGKEALEKGEKNKVIFDKTLPKDVNKWRLFFLALFCGWFGLQYEKVGRKKLFYYLLFSFCLFVLFTIFLITNIFSTSIIYEKYWAFLALAMILPSSFGLIIWFFSVLQILTNTFKVPVAIDENIVINDYDIKIAGEILSDVKSNRTENNVKNTSRKKNKVVCKSCGRSVWVFEGEKICPKCDENLEG